MKFCTIGPVVSEEKSFEIVDRRRTIESAYTISYPRAVGSDELEKKGENFGTMQNNILFLSDRFLNKYYQSRKDNL